MFTVASALSSDVIVALTPAALVFKYFAAFGKVMEGLAKVLNVFK